MSNREAGESRSHTADDEPPRLDVHLGELYRLRPLPDEFVRLAIAVGESCQRLNGTGTRSSFNFRYALRRGGR